MSFGIRNIKFAKFVYFSFWWKLVKYLFIKIENKCIKIILNNLNRCVPPEKKLQSSYLVVLYFSVTLVFHPNFFPMACYVPFLQTFPRFLFHKLSSSIPLICFYCNDFSFIFVCYSYEHYYSDWQKRLTLKATSFLVMCILASPWWNIVFWEMWGYGITLDWTSFYREDRSLVRSYWCLYHIQ